MALNADAIAYLADKGLSLEEVIEFARVAERKADPTAAERKRRQRERDRAAANGHAVTVTRDTNTLDKKAPQTPEKINPKDPPISPQKRASTPAKPEDVSESTWSDWLVLRKSKRAPVTAGVIASARQEAAKLGWTLEKMLATWVFRGSQGFQAEWVTGNKATGPPNDASFLDHVIQRQAQSP